MGKSIKAVRTDATQAGFTIIEVLIVLAIAGLILLIVFEALPALERSGRNNQRRQDVSAILEAISHYELNNSGGFPAACGTGGVPLCAASISEPLYQVQLTYYTTAGNVTITPQSNAPPGTPDAAKPQGPNTNFDTVNVYNYEVCDTGSAGATSTGAGYNDVVALYALEAGGNDSSPQCQQL